jgi:hypothetical protein
MFPAEREKLLHEKITTVLKSNPRGLTMTDIVKATKSSRKAIEKHLQVLILQNEIYMKQFGITKVYYPNYRVHHMDFERLDYGNRTIWFDVLENEFGTYLLIQKKKKTGNEWVHEQSITIPIEQGERFVTVLDKIMHSSRMKSILESRNKAQK